MAVSVQNNCKKYMDSIKKKISYGMQEISIGATATVQSNTPVVKGHLKKSFQFKRIDSNTKFKTVVGSKVIYSLKVNMISKKNKNFFNNALMDYSQEAKEILIRFLREM